MSKFASKSTLETKKARSRRPVVNKAGGPGYSMTEKLELVSILLTSFIQDQFYRTENGTIVRIKELLGKVDPKFAAQAAIFARNEFGMRSVSHVVAGELAHSVKGADWTRGFFDAVVRRADDPAEILAYYLATYGKPIPNALKRGLATALNRFDEYGIAKYRRENSPFKLVDAVNLLFGTKARPKAVAGHQDGALSRALGKLVRGELEAAGTWETKLTQAGQSAETESAKVEMKAAAWRELVLERKLGYLALIRNLRNILAGADADVLKALCEQLTNRASIKKSLVFPFQIQTAFEAVSAVSGANSRKLMAALNDAVDISCDNIPKLEGDTVIFLDVSASMGGRVAEIASLFAAVMCKAWNADLIQFAESAKHVNYNPSDSTMTLARGFRYSGGGTNMPAAIKAMRKRYARVVILSDMQTWMGGPYCGNPQPVMRAYEKQYDAKPYVYSFDLQAQGTLAFPEDRVAAIAGFSDKVFNVMEHLEKDRQALVHTIEQVPLVRQVRQKGE